MTRIRRPVARWTTRAALAAALSLAGLAAAAADEVVWWAPNWEQGRAETIVKAFEAATPGTTVRIEYTVSDGLQNRILVALQSGTPPDLVDVQGPWTIPFAQTGKLDPLDDTLKSAGIDTATFLPPAVKAATYEGKLYGLPYRVEAQALVYNKAAYRAAGLDPDKPPQTWDELLDTARKLTRKADAGQQYGFGITGGGEVGNTVYRSLPFIWMNGGSMVSDDLKSGAVTSPEAVQAVEFYAGMLTKEHVSPPSTLQNDGVKLRDLFVAGTVAQYQTGQYDLGPIHKANPKLEVGVAMIPHPAGKQSTAILGGWAYVIPSEAAHKEGAAKLLAWLAKPDVMGVYTDTFPARTDAMSLPRFQNPELAAFKAMLPLARATPPTPAWIQISQAYFNHLQEVMLGQSSAADAMGAANDEITGLLNQ